MNKSTLCRGLGWFNSLLSSNLVWLGGELSERINSTKKGDISRAHISLALFLDIYILFKKQAGVYYPGGGGDSHVKVTGMLVVSLKGVHCRFWSHVGCLQWKVTIFDHSGIA